MTASASASIPLTALGPAFRSIPRLSPELDQNHRRSSAGSRLASPVPSSVSVNTSITLSSPNIRSHITIGSPKSTRERAREPAKAAPSLEEFLADIERRRHQNPLGNCTNPDELARYMANTGQQNDSVELVETRNMALAVTGTYAKCTPIMAWNRFFGDKRAFEDALFAQRDAEEAEEVQKGSTRRPKLAAAEKAAGAWKELSPRQRQRRQEEIGLTVYNIYYNTYYQ